MDAVNLRIAEKYLEQFGKLADENNTMIIPSDLSDVSGVVASITKVLKQTSRQGSKNEPSK